MNKNVFENQLRITEIFHSLQGESTLSGLPTTFVRLTGCPLRCLYCDSEYAFSGGEKMTLQSILDEANRYRSKRVCVTGGEPLAQPNCLPLMKLLCDEGFEVSIETSGALAIERIDPRVIVVMDVKTPDSGEVLKNRLENLKHLKTTDQIKFVICSRGDYDFAKLFIEEHDLFGQCEILFSPSYEQVPAKDLANWIVNDSLAVRFQLQIHKFLWGDIPGV